MLISKITINELRDIETIQINIDDNLIAYLNNKGEPKPSGGGSSYFFNKEIKNGLKVILVDFIYKSEGKYIFGLYIA